MIIMRRVTNHCHHFQLAYITPTLRYFAEELISCTKLFYYFFRVYSYLGGGLIDSHFYSVLRPPGCSSLTPSLCAVARKEVISAEGHTPAVYHIELSKATTLLKSIEDEHNCIAGERNILLDQTSLCGLLPIFFIRVAFVVLKETLSLSLLLTFHINLKRICMCMCVMIYGTD